MSNVVYVLRYQKGQGGRNWTGMGERFKSRNNLLEKLRMMKSQPEKYRDMYVTEIRQWTPEEEEQYLSE